MMLNKFVSLLCLCVIYLGNYSNGETRKFPTNFQFGVATASYQIEGGWNASDKSVNIWDHLTHTTDLVKDKTNGDIACDSYHKINNDLEMLKELGVDFYRFSISWSRLLPNGHCNKISEVGFQYYNKLIDDLLSANITPIVTLYHWDLPQSLQELGGWANPLIINYVTDYADIAFKLYGEKVKTWVTINEPLEICVGGYGMTILAPNVNMSGIADYLCAHHVVKAQAAIYHLYDEKYRSIQKGRVGMSQSSNWFEPASHKLEDIEAAERSLQFTLGLYANPIFSSEGDYPKVVKNRIAKISAEQGFPRTRLPEFTSKEIEYIKGASDFFGLNHYTTNMVKNPGLDYKFSSLYEEDKFVIEFKNDSWPTSSLPWLTVVPWGFTKMLKWIRDNYNNPEVIVAENGFSDKNETDDEDRINYYNKYLNAMLDAMDDGCNVTAYTAWSLMDNFEWTDGYTQRFGLYYVNFEDVNRTRTPKRSAFFYKGIISKRNIDHP